MNETFQWYPDCSNIFQAMMDRERKDELPKMQVGFIDVVCRPLYTSLSESFPWIKPLLDGCLANREKWADLAEKVHFYANEQTSSSFQWHWYYRTSSFLSIELFLDVLLIQ